jgi:hypothetical protein
MSTDSRSPFAALPPWPDVSFAEFGEVEIKPIHRIQRVVGSIIARNSVMILERTHELFYRRGPWVP